jgi:2-methylisocitrate lyase-like PEP mutase family enzyme
VKEIVRASAPLPVNVNVSGPVFTLRQLEDIGVRRVSTGAGLARAAWAGFMQAAKGLAESGSFEGFANIASSKELDALFSQKT